jgi:hypothetical protein
LALQPTVGFGLWNNVLPFFPICHQFSWNIQLKNKGINIKNTIYMIQLYMHLLTYCTEYCWIQLYSPDMNNILLIYPGVIFLSAWNKLLWVLKKSHGWFSSTYVIRII